MSDKTMTELEEIDPELALELYLDDRRSHQSKATTIAHRSRLSSFVDWLDERGIDNLNELTGRLVKEYKLHRRKESDWASSTEKSNLDTIRVFVRWAEGIEAVEANLSQRVQSPVLNGDENVRHTELDSETAEKVLSHLETYQYCSPQHVTLALIWHTMCRRSAVRALDLKDYDAEDQHLHFVHRPESGTPLKNKERSNRYMAVSDSIAELLDDWIANKRPEVVDEYGRKPLLSSKNGRLHKSTISGYAYKYTQPCKYEGECPVDGRDQQSCAAASHQKLADCPESVSPHPFRRGSITHWLRSDVPPRVISDRADVSEQVIEKHYDERSELEEMEQRREFLDSI